MCCGHMYSLYVNQAHATELSVVLKRNSFFSTVSAQIFIFNSQRDIVVKSFFAKLTVNCS